MLAVGLAALLLAGCGGGSQTVAEPRPEKTRPEVSESAETTQELAVTLDGWAGPATVGILMAEKRGYFADLGPEVRVLSPWRPVRSIPYVVDGTDVFGVSHEPEVVMAKERGAPIVAVGSLISQPTAAMIWLKGSGINGVADLKGKTIATLGLSFQEGFLQRILARGGLTLDDVKVEGVGYKLVPALVGGRADAIFGGSWNLEGAELESRGLKPVITRVQGLGIPTYDELVVIARTDRVSKEPQLVRKFMSAVARGTDAAVKDPKDAVHAIATASERNFETSRNALEAQIEATLPLLSKSGYMSPRQAGSLVDWMRAQGLIERKPPVSALLTNDFR